MFNNTLNPDLISFNLFSTTISLKFYSLVYILGVFLIYYVLYKDTKRNKSSFFKSTEELDIFIFVTFLLTILFARLVHVFFYYPSYYLNNPIEIFMTWKGGLSFHGGLIGFFLSSLFFSKKYKFNFVDLLNKLSLSLAIVLGLGRIANFFNHEIYGTITSLPWCVYFNNVVGCRHPAQLYEALVWFLIVIFLLVFRNNSFIKKNRIFFGIAIYSFFRFFIEFIKDIKPEFLFLKTGQFLSLITFIFSIYMIIRNINFNKNRKKLIIKTKK